MKQFFKLVCLVSTLNCAAFAVTALDVLKALNEVVGDKGIDFNERKKAAGAVLDFVGTSVVTLRVKHALTVGSISMPQLEVDTFFGMRNAGKGETYEGLPVLEYMSESLKSAGSILRTSQSRVVSEVSSSVWNLASISKRHKLYEKYSNIKSHQAFVALLFLESLTYDEADKDKAEYFIKDLSASTENEFNPAKYIKENRAELEAIRASIPVTKKKKKVEQRTIPDPEEVDRLEREDAEKKMNAIRASITDDSDELYPVLVYAEKIHAEGALARKKAPAKRAPVVAKDTKTNMYAPRNITRGELSVSMVDVGISKPKLKLINVSRVKKIKDASLMAAPGGQAAALREIDFINAKNLEEIGSAVLWSHKNLERLILSKQSKLNKIGDMFMNGVGNVEVVWPADNNIETIGKDFMRNSGITEFSFEGFEKLNSIGENLFAGCKNLEIIYIRNEGQRQMVFEALSDEFKDGDKLKAGGVNIIELL